MKYSLISLIIAGLLLLSGAPWQVTQPHVLETELK
jgi:hypothetical protein